MKRVAITGCRPPLAGDRSAAHAIYFRILDDVRVVIAALPAGTTVVHGDAEGVDALARDLAKARGLRTEAHPPHYDAYPQKQRWRAPLDRNVYVTSCAEVYAWPAPWSRGTLDAIAKARRAKMHVDVRKPWESPPAQLEIPLTSGRSGRGRP